MKNLIQEYQHRLFILIVLLIFCITRGFAQIKNSKLISNSNSCNVKWKFIEQDKDVEGIVVYHAVAPFHCGVLAAASVLIIKTKENSLYRIIELCNVDTLYLLNEIVSVKPSKSPTFSFSIPFYKTYGECTIIDTYFGEVYRKKN